MKIVTGLGNPGSSYEHNRHNAGFLALDFYLRNKSVIDCASRFEAKICELHSGDNKIFFVKPQTFMNHSGKALKQIADFYKVVPSKDLLILHDEVDLPLGTVRSAFDSSSAGHNGVQDIFNWFGTESIHRIRIGVESRTDKTQLPTDAFVLQNFSDQELQVLRAEVFPTIDGLIEHF